MGSRWRGGTGKPIRARASIAAAALALALAVPASAERRIPELTGPVVDLAGVVDSGSREAIGSLAQFARSAESGTGVQLVVLVVPSLEGEEIESFSLRVAGSWGLGTKGKDNGVLVTVSTGDRKARIEVGRGLEGMLTSDRCSAIIERTKPAFREQRYGEGLLLASREILGALSALPPAEAEAQAAPLPERSRWSALPLLIALGISLIATAVIFVLLRLAIDLALRVSRWSCVDCSAGGGGYTGWSGGSSGSSWSGGSSGGGWSSGGGSFGGGGASGSW